MSEPVPAGAPGPLRVVVEQIEPVLGRPDRNAGLVREAVGRADADLVVFPELALTGYGLRGRTPEVAVPEGRSPVSGLPDDGPVAVVGYVEEGRDHRLYNAAGALRGDELLAVHRKVYLPTYGMFDEGRDFAPGSGPLEGFDVAPGWRTGLLVCEDLWHPGLAYLLALDGVDLLLVLAAAPGRGTPTGDDASPPRLFQSTERWALLARTTAFVHGVYVVLADRVGVEGGVTFAGRSLIAAPDGRIVAEAAEGREDRLEATLSGEGVRSARRPFSHLRDEDPTLLFRELGRRIRDPSTPDGDGGP